MVYVVVTLIIWQFCLFGCITAGEELSQTWHVVKNAHKLECENDIVKTHSPTLTAKSLYYQHISEDVGLYYGSAYRQGKKIFFHLPAHEYSPETDVDLAWLPLSPTEQLLALKVFALPASREPLVVTAEEYLRDTKEANTDKENKANKEEEGFRVVARDLLGKTIAKVGMHEFVYASDMDWVVNTEISTLDSLMLLTGYKDSLLWRGFSLSPSSLPLSLQESFPLESKSFLEWSRSLSLPLSLQGSFPAHFRYGDALDHHYFFYGVSREFINSRNMLEIARLSLDSTSTREDSENQIVHKQTEFTFYQYIDLTFEPLHMTMLAVSKDEVWLALIEKTKHSSQGYKHVLHIYHLSMSLGVLHHYSHVLEKDAYYKDPFFVEHHNRVYVGYLSWIYEDKTLSLMELSSDGKPKPLKRFSGMHESAYISQIFAGSDGLHLIVREGKEPLKKRFSLCFLEL